MILLKSTCWRERAPAGEARRGIFPQLEGNPKPERQVQRGRKRRSSGRKEGWERIVSAHLPGDCRVQITPQLLEIRVRRVFHLEALLLGGEKSSS